MWIKVKDWFAQYWTWVLFPIGLLLLLVKLGIFVAGRTNQPIDLSNSFDRWADDKAKIDKTVGDRLAEAEKRAHDALKGAEDKAASDKKKTDTTDGLRDSLGDKFGRSR